MQIEKSFVLTLGNGYGLLTVINDTYEQLDALTACFPWCTTTTARCIPRGNRCKITNIILCVFKLRFDMRFSKVRY